MSNVLMLPTLSIRVDSVIRDLLDALELPAGDVSRYEFLHEYVINTPCSRHAFERGFQHERVQGWFETLASSLSVSFTLVAGSDSFQASLRHDDLSALGTSADWLAEYEVERADVRVTIRKDGLIDQVHDALGVNVSILFFYEGALVKRLALTKVQDLVSGGLVSVNQHIVVVILTGCGLLQSPMLTVAGLVDASPSDFVTLPSPTGRVRSWKRIHSLRETTCTWTAPLGDTSPDAFDAAEVRPGLSPVRREMMRVCGTLSLLQFCTSIRRLDGSEWAATVALPGATFLRVTSTEGPTLPRNGEESEYRAAHRLFRWAFQAESYDKIDIVRDLLQQEVRDHAINRSDELMPFIPQLIETARANFKTLRHEAFEAYMQARNGARAAVQAFVVSTQQRLDTLRHDVLDTTLKFSAAIIAFLAADVLKPGLSNSVVVVGFIFGLIYLALAFGLQLLPLRAQYEAARRHAENAVGDLRELTTTERSRILSDLPSKTGWTPFKRWFAISCGIYAGWAIVLLLVAIFIAAGGNAGHPIPSATPTFPLGR